MKTIEELEREYAQLEEKSAEVWCELGRRKTERVIIESKKYFKIAAEALVKAESLEDVDSLLFVLQTEVRENIGAASRILCGEARRLKKK